MSTTAPDKDPAPFPWEKEDEKLQARFAAAREVAIGLSRNKSDIRNKKIAENAAKAAIVPDMAEKTARAAKQAAKRAEIEAEELISSDLRMKIEKDMNETESMAKGFLSDFISGIIEKCKVDIDSNLIILEEKKLLSSIIRKYPQFVGLRLVGLNEDAIQEKIGALINEIIQNVQSYMTKRKELGTVENETDRERISAELGRIALTGVKLCVSTEIANFERKNRGQPDAPTASRMNLTRELATRPTSPVEAVSVPPVQPPNTQSTSDISEDVGAVIEQFSRPLIQMPPGIIATPEITSLADFTAGVAAILAGSEQSGIVADPFSDEDEPEYEGVQPSAIPEESAPVPTEKADNGNKGYAVVIDENLDPNAFTGTSKSTIRRLFPVRNPKRSQSVPPPIPDAAIAKLTTPAQNPEVKRTLPPPPPLPKNFPALPRKPDGSRP